MFLGMSRGSVGDVTFYRGYGQQLARARNRNPRNPKTEAQVIQRMILSTASKAYARLKSITDHSFQGIAYGGRSQQYFLRRAMEYIRTFVAANYPTPSVTSILDFIGLSEPRFAAAAGVGLLISEGTLPTIQPRIGTDGILLGFGNGFGEVGEGGATVQQVMNCVGAAPGDQVTVLALLGSGLLDKSRYVFKSQLSAAELSATWSGEASMAALDSDTLVGDIQLRADETYVNVSSFIDNSIVASAIILSRKSGSDWLRSSQRLVPASDNLETFMVENGPDVVIPIWLAGSAVIDAENAYYLNQADE